MRTVGAGQSAQPGNVTPRVWIADSSDVLVDRTTSGVVVEYDDPSADAPIGAATITFRRGDGAASLAPLMTANPPIDLNRRVMVEVPVGGGAYKEVFRGAIDRVQWPERFGDVVIECRDQARTLADTRIETIRAYGSAAGVALETVAQSVLTDNLASPPTLYVPTATGAVVVWADGAEPYQPGESVYESQKHLADSIGWAARYRYIDSLSDWRFTLFEPARTKTVADHTFGASDYFDVSMMEQDIEDIRNVVVVEYTDADGVRQTVTVSDAASITKYGRRYAKISEASDSPIDTAAKATQLANAALSDLKEPDAILEVRCPYFWPGEVGVDLYTFTANGEHFSSDQTLAPVSIRHRIGVGERSETRIVCRGAPSSGVLTWRKRAQPPTGGPQFEDKPETKLLQNFNPRDSADGLSEVITWTNGAKLEEVWYATQTFTAPITSTAWDTVAAAVVPFNPLLTETLTVLKPTETDGTGRVTLVQIEGRWVDPATGDLVVGQVWRRAIYSKTHINAIDPETGDLNAGTVARAQIVDAAINAAKMDDGILDLTEFSRIVANGAIIGGKLSVDELSEIADGLGILVSGILQNAATPTAAIRLSTGDTLPGTAVNYLDLAATGANPVLKTPDVTLNADGSGSLGSGMTWDTAGNVTFSGALSAATGTFAGDLSAAGGTFDGALSAATGTFAGDLSAVGGTFDTITAGVLQNAAASPTAAIRLASTDTLPGTATTYLDLAATGAGAVLAHNELSLNADGTADWSTAVLNPPALTAADASGSWDAVNTETDYSVTWTYNSEVGTAHRIEIQFFHNGGLIDSVDAIAHNVSQPYLHSVDDTLGAASGGTVSVIVVLYDNTSGAAISSITTRERLQGS